MFFFLAISMHQAMKRRCKVVLGRPEAFECSISVSAFYFSSLEEGNAGRELLPLGLRSPEARRNRMECEYELYVQEQ